MYCKGITSVVDKIFAQLRYLLPVPVAERSGVGLRPPACWDCGYESHRGHGCPSVVSVVCCTGRGLCDELITRQEETYRVWCVVECDLETSWMSRPWHTEGCCAKKKVLIAARNSSVRLQQTTQFRTYVYMNFVLVWRTSFWDLSKHCKLLISVVLDDG